MRFVNKTNALKIYTRVSVVAGADLSFLETYHFLSDAKFPKEKVSIALSVNGKRHLGRGRKQFSEKGICGVLALLELNGKTIHGHGFDQVIKNSFCIYSLYIDEEYRGLGMADILFYLAAQLAVRTSKENVLLVYPSSGLNDFYQKYGFYPAPEAFAQVRDKLMKANQTPCADGELMTRYNNFYLLQASSCFLSNTAWQRVSQKWHVKTA